MVIADPNITWVEKLLRLDFCSKTSEKDLSFHTFPFYPMDFMDIVSKYGSDFYLLSYSYR